MKILINPPREQWDEILDRPSGKGGGAEDVVAQMLTSLKESGWAEVCRMTGEFDGYNPEPALVTEEELNAAGEELPAPLKYAIALAANNIRKFHESQVRTANLVDISPGITCYQRWLPVERVGLYIPGGTAPLFSTVLMLAIPARIAGCQELVLCSPGDRQGKIHPAILYAAAYCGVTKVYRIGGVQAIAAMGFGLGPVPKVDKIFGPGNAWVTMAKQLISRTGVAIDMPAGPSELMVVADDSANSAFVAADLLSQAEHGADSQVLMLTMSWELAEQVHLETERQLGKLPRKDIAAKALDNSKIVVLKDERSILEMVNRYAPEHLILAIENYREMAEQVKNAGSVFLGNYSPESAGDYASGTNHTLPTSGFARAYSGLNLDSFLKSISFQELTAGGLHSIEPAISLMARAEGLEAHAKAAEIRRIDETRDDRSDHRKKKQGEGENQEIDGNKPNLFDYLNPLNILNPLNLFDPANELSPLTLLNRLSEEKQADVIYRTNIADLVRPNIARLIPYSSARDEFSGHEGIFLDANENPNETGLNRYPDPRQGELRTKIAELKGLDPGTIFLGNGSDEAIDLLIRIFCEPGKSRIITLNPTYGMYAVCAGIQDAEVDRVLLNPDFSINLKAILGTVRFDTKMIFLCTPNNPTGNLIPISEIRYLAKHFKGIIVVDEAYMDFSEGPSALTLLDDCLNIVVLQTFSKAWGMAGVRLGMAFANHQVITLMNRVKYPYNINVLSAAKVGEAIRQVVDSRGKSGKRVDKQAKDRPDIRLILTERIRLADRLKGVAGVEKVYPSDANFLLVKFTDPKGIYQYLTSHGIIVRDRSNQALCEGCLRITVGTPAENDKLIDLLINL
jgi:histidinol dehydrogenase